MEQPEVPTEHLHEHAEHAAKHGGERWTLGVALSCALLAALAAVASLQAGHHANEAMISQITAANQWSFFQSKSIKESQLKSKMDIFAALDKPVSEADKKKAGEYESEKEKIQETAKEKEKEAGHELKTHQIFATSVTLFQIAIAIGAISALTKRKRFWFVSLACGAVGFWFFVQAFLFAGH
jgi:lipopolysaccharide export LptBFGC system permease protein LptF